MELMERRRILLNTPHISLQDGMQFNTDIVAPLQSANIRIEPVQSGSGDPSPSNVRPITGSEGVTLSVTGKNLYDCAEFSSYKQADGTYRLTGADATATKVYFPKELAGKEIVVSVYLDLTKETGPSYIRLRAVIDGVSKNGGAVNNNNAGYSTVTVTPTSTSDYFYMTYGSNGSNYYTFGQLQVEFKTGSGRTSYEPYTSSRYSINWGENLIGGLAFAEQVKKVMPAATLDTTAQTISFSGTTTSSQPIEIVTGIFKPNTQYTFIHTGTTGNTKNIRWIYDDDSVDTATRPANSAYVSTAGKTVKALEKINNNGASVTFQYMNCGVFEGVLEVDDFEPYVGEVYGGTVDFTTGILTVNKKIASVSAIDYVLGNYIKSDAIDGYVNVNEIYPVKGSTGYKSEELTADRLKFQNKSIWATVGFPNCWSINGLQIHVNIANDLLGVTDYTQETTTTAKTKLNAWLANNPVTVTIPIRPVTYQLTPQQILALKGINNLSMSGQVKFWTHRDI